MHWGCYIREQAWAHSQNKETGSHQRVPETNQMLKAYDWLYLVSYKWRSTIQDIETKRKDLQEILSWPLILVLQNSSNGPEGIADANERIVGISFPSPLPANQHRPKLHCDAMELSKAVLHSLGVHVILVGD